MTKKTSLVLIDLVSNPRKRPNFAKILEFIETSEKVEMGFHVLSYPYSVDPSSVQKYLPDVFVPLYQPYSLPRNPALNGETVSDLEWELYSLKKEYNSLKAHMESMLDVSLRIQDKVMDNPDIVRLHAICEHDVYTTLFKHMRQMNIDVTVYSPNANLRVHASNFVSWTDFSRECLVDTRPNRDDLELATTSVIAGG